MEECLQNRRVRFVFCEVTCTEPLAVEVSTCLQNLSHVTDEVQIFLTTEDDLCNKPSTSTSGQYMCNKPPIFADSQDTGKTSNLDKSKLQDHDYCGIR